MLDGDRGGPQGRQWDAVGYDRVSAPLEGLGVEVLDRAQLRGDETVLDAGCGSGRITAHLAQRLPAGRVIAVDSSPAMVEQARQRLGDDAEVLIADLREIELTEPVDVVVSTATFHWLLDHDRLFARLFAVLRPGGRLVAQCGGAGNIQAVLGVANQVANGKPYAKYLHDFSRPSHFATDTQTAERLGAAGFDSIECRLTPRPVVPDDPLDYLKTITLGPHLEALPDELRPGFADAVLEAMTDPPTIDYVRLDVDARRPAI